MEEGAVEEEEAEEEEAEEAAEAGFPNTGHGARRRK